MVTSWQQTREKGGGLVTDVSLLAYFQTESITNTSDYNRSLNVDPELQSIMRTSFLTFLPPTEWAPHLSGRDMQRGQHQERFVNTSIFTTQSEQQALQQGQVVPQVHWQLDDEGQTDGCAVSVIGGTLYSVWYSIVTRTDWYVHNEDVHPSEIQQMKLTTSSTYGVSWLRRHLP